MLWGGWNYLGSSLPGTLHTLLTSSISAHSTHAVSQSLSLARNCRRSFQSPFGRPVAVRQYTPFYASTPLSLSPGGAVLFHPWSRRTSRGAARFRGWSRLPSLAEPSYVTRGAVLWWSRLFSLLQPPVVGADRPALRYQVSVANTMAFPRPANLWTKRSGPRVELR